MDGDVSLSDARRELLARRLAGTTRAAPAAPSIGPAPHQTAEPFALTQVQQAYWVGRDPELDLGGVAAYGYAEYDVPGLDLERLETAWNRLIARHPALRTVVLADGRQQFLAEVPRYEIAVSDLRVCSPAERRERLQTMRDELSHRVPPADTWPLFDVRASRLDEGLTRVHVGFDTLIADARSFELLSTELDMLLDDPDAPLPPIGVTFRDWVLAHAGPDGPEWERSRAYWFDRLGELARAPDLPLAAPAARAHPPRFERHAAGMDAGTWQALCARAQARRVTPSGVMLAAYAETLGGWSAAPEFTLNLTLFNRGTSHPDIDRVVGCFTALSLLAVDLGSATTFEARAQRLQEQLWRDLEHRSVDAVTVIRELGRRRGAPQQMPVVFTSALGTEAGRRSRLGEPVFAISQTPQVWIDCQVVTDGGGVAFWWDVASDPLAPGMVGEMFDAYQALVVALAADDAPWGSSRPVRPPAGAIAARAALEDSTAWDGSSLLHELAELSDAARIAVTGAAGSCTAGALDARADRLAAALQSHGVTRGSLVAVATARGPGQVAAVLGVLRSGAAYVPLDAALPRERREALLHRSGATVVVTDLASAEANWPRTVATMGIEDLPDARPAPIGLSPDDIAYVMFTSGSTGVPKGVMMAHGAVANTLQDMCRRLRLGPADAILAVSDLSFDLSVFDLFGALMTGAVLVTVPDAIAGKDPAHWADLAERHGVTVWNTVPALMVMLVDHLQATGRRLDLRTVVLSGDWIPLDLADRVRAVAPHVEVLGAGGATEAAIWSVAYPIEQVDPSWTSVPYGFPLVNQTARVRDVRGELPDWVPGELHIGGAGVASGYLGAPDLTADRFVPDPSRPGARLYRTGDMARHLPGGRLEFLGRSDAQVKINGHRVDLSEVEAAIAGHPAVSAACAVASGPRDGARQLHGFAVAEADMDLETLREHVAGLLPAYMVPIRIERLDRLPLTPNGKLDRKRLAQLAEARSSVSAPDEATVITLERPRPVAELVARVVGEALRLAAPPRLNDDLLMLGADSVTIVRIGNRLQALLGVTPRLETMYADPTPAGIAVECERLLVESPGPRQPPPNPASPGLATAIRRAGAGPAVALAGRTTDASARWERVRSRRRPLEEPVSLAQLGALLEELRELDTAAGGRRLYASASALYAVRAYVAVARGGVDGLTAGMHLYDPIAHALLGVGGDALRADDFEPFVNRPIVARASFLIVLTALMPRLRQTYPEHASRFALLEAGAVAQLLRAAAPEAGIALCAIGDPIPPAFAAATMEPGEEALLLFAGGALDPAEPAAADGDEAPLSAAQTRLLVLDELAPAQPDFNIPVAMRAFGAVDEDALSRALDALVARHEVLRSGFTLDGGVGVQRVARTVAVPCEIREASSTEAAVAAARDEALRPFDLSQPPTVRALVLRIAPEARVIVIAFHHVSCDERALRLALRELAAIYAELVGGPPADLPRPERQYRHYVDWERSADPAELDAALTYWRDQLAGLPAPKQRAAGSRADVTARTADIAVAPPAAAALVALARAERTTMFNVVLTALAVALAEALGRSDVAIGIPSDDRRRLEFDETIGSFVNTLVLRSHPADAASFRAAMHDTRDVLRDGLANGGVPYDRVVHAIPEAHRRGELYDAWLVLREPTPPLTLEGIAVEPIDLAGLVAPHTLKLDLTHGEDGLAGKLIGRCDRWHPAEVARLAVRIPSLLAAAAVDADAPLVRLLAQADAAVELLRESADADARDRLRGARRRPGR